MTFCGFFQPSYHLTILELSFAILNNARLESGAGPLFSPVHIPLANSNLLARHHLDPSALARALADGFGRIRERWTDVGGDLTPVVAQERMQLSTEDYVIGAGGYGRRRVEPRDEQLGQVGAAQAEVLGEALPGGPKGVVAARGGTVRAIYFPCRQIDGCHNQLHLL
jgi:hypothetical protein